VVETHNQYLIFWRARGAAKVLTKLAQPEVNENTAIPFAR
jgi:hypothetical protein